MQQRSPAIMLSLAAALMAGLPVESTAQALEPGGPRPSAEGEIEEIVVRAERIEGSGGRRRAAAGREQLDRSDQTDMEGFFDDIDGLSTLGGDGDGNSFSIDGLSADLGMVTLNGQGFGEGRGSGGMNAGNLPPEMIRRVDVFRIPAASMEEGGAGGYVNLQLRNPIEITRPSTNLKGRLGYVPDKANFSPSTSLFLGRPSKSRDFGYMLNLNLTERLNESGSQDITNWIPREADGSSIFIPSQVRNSTVRNEQRNLFAGLTLGFRPLPSLDIGARLLASRNLKDTVDHGLQHRVDRQRDIQVLEFDGRIATALESSDRSRRNLRIVGSTREDRIDSMMLGTDFVWRRDRWRLEGAAGYDRVENQSDQPALNAQFSANSPFGYGAGSDGSLIMSYANGFPANREFSTTRFSLSDRQTEDTNKFGSLDLVRPLGDGFLRRLRLGGKVRVMSRSRRTATGQVTVDESLVLDDFFTGHYQRTPWDTSEWPGSDLALVEDLARDSPVEWEENLLNRHDIERRSSAGYLQADFRADLREERFLVGNMGARVVKTETRIAGFQPEGEGVQPISRERSDTDVLPGFSVRMRIAERAGLTLGAARVMTHPAFNDLAPGIRINEAEKSAKSGNPDLEPFRADQYLAELTWSPERGRRLSGSLVYRDVESYFADGEEPIEVNGDTYLVTRPVNGYGGHILTARLAVVQNLRRLTRHLQNFSASINYTYNRSGTEMRDLHTGEKLPMPNTAEHVVRAQLAYDKAAFAGKLIYQWRGESLKSSIGESGLSIWNQPAGSLNLNLGWQLNSRLQFNLDARNLLGEEQIRTTDHDRQLWRINERDRSVAATLRAKW